jgi:hypothetical protein
MIAEQTAVVVAEQLFGDSMAVSQCMVRLGFGLGLDYCSWVKAWRVPLVATDVENVAVSKEESEWLMASQMKGIYCGNCV